MTGPEHLRHGKRILTAIREESGTVLDMQVAATVALAHMMAAQVCATVDTVLADRVSWAEASEA
jgi:hypothetical protein